MELTYKEANKIFEGFRKEVGK